MTTLENSDRQVQSAVTDELRFTPNIDSTHIAVAVNRGAVTLTGEVDTFPEKRAAEKAALRIRGVQAGCVTATVHHRQVTLTGSTPWQYQRAACVRAIHSLHGIAGLVNEVTVRPTLTPEGISEAISAALVRSAELAGGNIVVTATGGDVTLEGARPHPAVRYSARPRTGLRPVSTGDEQSAPEQRRAARRHLSP